MIIELEFGPRSADSEASILTSKTSSRSGQVFLWGLSWGQRLRTRLWALQAYLFPYPIFPLNKHLRTVRLGLHGPIQEVSYRVWASWPRSLLAMSPVNTGQ